MSQLFASILHPTALMFGAPFGTKLFCSNGYDPMYVQTPRTDDWVAAGLRKSNKSFSAAQGAAGALGAGTYKYRFTEYDSLREAESDPTASDVSVTIAASKKITVTLPGTRRNSRADKIRIYRSVVGGSYPSLFLVDTVPYTDTSYSDNTLDSVLNPDVGEGRQAISNLNGIPPRKPYVITVGQRVFAWGSYPYTTGHATTSNPGSLGLITEVPSDGTYRWHAGMEGDYFQVSGENKRYRIENFDETAHTFELCDEYGTRIPYDGTPTASQDYYICGDPNTLRWSEDGMLWSESWPAANVKEIDPGDGDHGTGCYPLKGGLVACKRKKTYTFYFSTFPSQAGVTCVSQTLGCISHRSMVDVHGTLYWLSDEGVVAFTGGEPRLISSHIDDFFDPIEGTLKRDSAGECQEAFSIWYPRRKWLMVFVPSTDAITYCDMCLVFDFSDPDAVKTTTFKFKGYEFSAGAIVRDSSGYERLILASYNATADASRIWTFDLGDTDGVISGTVEGTVSSGNATTLTCATAAFYNTGTNKLKGCYVTVSRTGQTDQTKYITANTATTLTVASWSWTPQAGDTFRIGASEAIWESGWSDFGTNTHRKGVPFAKIIHNKATGGSIKFENYTDFGTTAKSLAGEADADGEFDYTAQELDLDADADGEHRIRLGTPVGWRHKFKLSNPHPNSPFTIYDVLWCVEVRRE